METVFSIGIRRWPKPGQTSAIWPLARRRAFLLNEGIDVPLSVDSSVWPAPTIAPATAQRLDEMRLTRFDDSYHLEDVRQVQGLLRLEIPRGDRWTLFGCDEKTNLSLCERVGLRPHQVGVSSVLGQSEWAFLGFDIADAGLTSGLSNCAFVGDEKQKLANQFAASLNEHGLFTDLDLANRFVEISNARVNEHAPFFAFGIWVQKE
jgi:hypothetical protein